TWNTPLRVKLTFAMFHVEQTFPHPLAGTPSNLQRFADSTRSPQASALLHRHLGLPRPSPAVNLSFDCNDHPSSKEQAPACHSSRVSQTADEGDCDCQPEGWGGKDHHSHQSGCIACT